MEKQIDKRNQLLNHGEEVTVLPICMHCVLLIIKRKLSLVCCVQLIAMSINSYLKQTLLNGVNKIATISTCKLDLQRQDSFRPKTSLFQLPFLRLLRSSPQQTKKRQLKKVGHRPKRVLLLKIQLAFGNCSYLIYPV